MESSQAGSSLGSCEALTAVTVSEFRELSAEKVNFFVISIPALAASNSRESELLDLSLKMPGSEEDRKPVSGSGMSSTGATGPW